jgi:ABC-type phosphate/phosphonate transport system substrate-binding protein
MAALPPGLKATFGEQHGNAVEVTLDVDVPAFIAGLAQRHADAAAKLAQCLAEFSDQPGCCAECLDAVDKTYADLCQVFAQLDEPAADEPLPAIPLYEG